MTQTLPERILCPIDFSPTSEHALELSIRLAAQFDARLEVLHVWTVADLRPGEHIPATDILAAVDQFVVPARNRGIRCSTAVRFGIPHEVILDFIRHEGIDTVVMGTHGRSGLRRVLLGSVTERVIRDAPVAVWTVRRGTQLPDFGQVVTRIDQPEARPRVHEAFPAP